MAQKHAVQWSMISAIAKNLESRSAALLSSAEPTSRSRLKLERRARSTRSSLVSRASSSAASSSSRRRRGDDA